MRKIVIANFYPVWPVMGGGQRRIFFLARELSKAFDVELVVPERSGVSKTLSFGSNLKETRIAVERRFRALEMSVDREVKMAADLAYTMHWRECVGYQEVLRERIQGAAAVVTAHPYSIYSILDARGQSAVPIVFDSQNVELKQKASVLKEHPRYLELIRKVEWAAIENSAIMFACSETDAADFTNEYGVARNLIGIIENGVDALGVPKLPGAVRSAVRSRLGVNTNLVCVFGGSFHFPNFRAADEVLQLATQHADVVFIVFGSVCKYERLVAARLKNVVCLGEIDESSKWVLLQCCDLGLNPMAEGSGTNIKMFEYAAAGLATLSTPFGARSVGMERESEFFEYDIGEFGRLVGELKLRDFTELRDMGTRARSKVLVVADWATIGRRYVDAFTDLIERQRR